jgi:hypothetical protein
VSTAGLNFLWRLLIFLVPFIFAQRWLHREIQAIFLLITRNPKATMILFSILFFPGVFVHEVSHFLAAKLLFVRTGRFSVVPKMNSNGTIRLGFVEAQQVDFIRNSLVGFAPLVSGGILISYLGSHLLGFPPQLSLSDQTKWGSLLQAVNTAIADPVLWLWFYIAFTVSSMMLPSSSDRRDWLPLILLLLALLGLALLSGAGPWLSDYFMSFLGKVFSGLTLVFAFSLFLHAVLLLPAWVGRLAISRITGLKVT